MGKILNAINEYSLKVFQHKYDYVTHTYGEYYMACFGRVTIYYEVTKEGVVLNAMVD